MSYPNGPTAPNVANPPGLPTAQLQIDGQMQQAHGMAQSMTPTTPMAASSQHEPPVRPMIGGTVSFPQYSASTEEILKRMSANGGAQAGWEAAREQVLQRMITSQNIITSQPTGPSRGRGRASGGNSGRAETTSTSAAKLDTPRKASGTTAGSPPTTSGRGRGGWRGRGGAGRGGRRRRVKKEDDDDDDDDLESSDNSSTSETLTSLPTKTKSGRRVHRPTHFDPATKTPTRRRGPYRRHAEATVCRVCQRGHSPQSNMIVFCDGCNTPYHQYCHDPPIGDEVVRVEEKEWFCADCTSVRKEGGTVGSLGEVELQKAVSGHGLSTEEKRAYLSRLPHSSLVSLLLHATSLYPNLAIFAPDTKSVVSPQTTGTIAVAAPSSKRVTSPPSAINNHLYQPAAAPSQQEEDHPMPDAPPPPPSFPSAHLQPTTTTIPLLPPHQHHPKPGHGIRLPPESEDLTWLIDDDITAFSHVYREIALPHVNNSHSGGGLGLVHHHQQQQQPHQRHYLNHDGSHDDDDDDEDDDGGDSMTRLVGIPLAQPSQPPPPPPRQQQQIQLQPTPTPALPPPQRGSNLTATATATINHTTPSPSTTLPPPPPAAPPHTPTLPNTTTTTAVAGGGAEIEEGADVITVTTTTPAAAGAATTTPAGEDGNGTVHVGGGGGGV